MTINKEKYEIAQATERGVNNQFKEVVENNIKDLKDDVSF